LLFRFKSPKHENTAGLLSKQSRGALQRLIGTIGFDSKSARVLANHRPSFCSIDHGEEDHVPFVALKLGGISTQDTVAFISIRWKVVSENSLDLDGLFLA
jgi:hypothetical protein